eukprot:3435684-Prymnesium_polylepis.1
MNTPHRPAPAPAAEHKLEPRPPATALPACTVRTLASTHRSGAVRAQPSGSLPSNTPRAPRSPLSRPSAKVGTVF